MLCCALIEPLSISFILPLLSVCWSIVSSHKAIVNLLLPASNHIMLVQCVSS